MNFYFDVVRPWIFFENVIIETSCFGWDTQYTVHTQAAPCSVFLNRSLAKVNSTAEHEIPPFTSLLLHLSPKFLYTFSMYVLHQQHRTP